LNGRRIYPAAVRTGPRDSRPAAFGQGSALSLCACSLRRLATGEFTGQARPAAVVDVNEHLFRGRELRAAAAVAHRMETVKRFSSKPSTCVSMENG
jgi:hypothetical protein